MAKDVAVNGALAAEVRRLAGVRTSRAAVESLMREFVRQRTDNGADDGNGQAADNGRSADNGKAAGNGAAESEAEIRARVARQHERIFKSAMAIAREGSPFRPDYDYKAQRRRDARRFAAKMRKLGWERE